MSAGWKRVRDLRLSDIGARVDVDVPGEGIVSGELVGFSPTVGTLITCGNRFVGCMFAKLPDTDDEFHQEKLRKRLEWRNRLKEVTG